MQLKEKIQKNLEINQNQLNLLLRKKENLLIQINNLENKIKNQKFALEHTSEDVTLNQRISSKEKDKSASDRVKEVEESLLLH